MNDQFAAKIYRDIIFDWEKNLKNGKFSSFAKASKEAGVICPEAKLYALPLDSHTISI
jgi:hypothetical protein